MNPEQPSPEIAEDNSLKVGSLIQLPKPPYLVRLVDDEDFGDLGNGKVSKKVFQNMYSAMSNEDQDKIKELNPNLNFD